KFSPEDPKNPTSPIINRLKKEKSLVFDSQVVYRDGSIIPVTISAKLVSKEGKGVIQSFIRDITERKQAEEALKRKNEELERFNRIAVGRELKMVELKKEINSLLKEMEKEPQYKIPAEKTK
ncbi:PAS domain S-box protein, partial [bacterium]|nr:PAS domain S-box protein [bacterium]